MTTTMDTYLAAADLAETRGWDREAHTEALRSGDIDTIGTTHPINWLTEEEAEEYFG